MSTEGACGPIGRPNPAHASPSAARQAPRPPCAAAARDLAAGVELVERVRDLLPGPAYGRQPRPGPDPTPPGQRAAAPDVLPPRPHVGLLRRRTTSRSPVRPVHGPPPADAIFLGAEAATPSGWRTAPAALAAHPRAGKSPELSRSRGRGPWSQRTVPRERRGGHRDRIRKGIGGVGGEGARRLGPRPGAAAAPAQDPHWTRPFLLPPARRRSASPRARFLSLAGRLGRA